MAKAKLNKAETIRQAFKAIGEPTEERNAKILAHLKEHSPKIDLGKNAAAAIAGALKSYGNATRERAPARRPRTVASVAMPAPVPQGMGVNGIEAELIGRYIAAGQYDKAERVIAALKKNAAE